MYTSLFISSQGSEQLCQAELKGPVWKIYSQKSILVFTIMLKLVYYYQKLRIVVWMSLSVMSQSHRIKGGAPDEAFQEQCFLWERGASVRADFDLFRFLYFKTIYTRTDITHWSITALF